MAENGIKKVLIQFYYCEMDRAREVHFSEEAWQLMKNTFEGVGVEVIEDPLPDPRRHSDIHRWRELLHAVHEVQGLKWEEGCTALPALESLINEYAKLK